MCQAPRVKSVHPERDGLRTDFHRQLYIRSTAPNTLSSQCHIFLMGIYYAGVDVGTGSARAVIVDAAGSILGMAERPIAREELKENHITQSSTEIWGAICYCVQTALSHANVDPESVLGIGFDATCSLVAVREATEAPQAVGPEWSNDLQNVVLWMDHRADVETLQINATGDECLKYVGGQMSIEMELPKMKWLKNHMPEEEGVSVFEKCKFYDLADYLTKKATGLETRSLSSVVCKQGYVPSGITNRNGWSKEFLEKVDLPELAEDNFRRLGGLDGVNGKYLSAGESVGPLSATAAAELGLTESCFVGSGVIDAYSGWIGTVAAPTNVAIPELVQQDKDKVGMGKATGRLAAVAGTSTCHICVEEKEVLVPGVWGPYRDVLGKGFWAAEGGQSMTGALLAHVLSTHPAYTELGVASETSNLSKFDYLNSRLEQLKMSRGERSVAALAKHLFFYGDFHGNRSPIADPNMRASIIGQSMDVSLDALAIEYLAACEFIGQQTRHIVETMQTAGHNLKAIFMSGGQCRNGLLMRLLADCTGLPIVIPRYIDASVVFGTAMLGAVAAEDAIIYSKTHKRKPSMSEKTALPPSPYTAPAATASYTSVSALAGEGYPFPQSFSPLREEVSDEDTLSFGAKPTQAKLAQSMETPADKLWRVMNKLSSPGKVIFPYDSSHPDRKLLNTKYKVFQDQIKSQQRYRALVDQTEKAIAEYLSV